MKPTGAPPPSVAIACGGTGGHLFPGLAVADQLLRRGCAVTVLISPKDVDQLAVKQAAGVRILTLPAVGLSRGRVLAFARGFAQSYRAAKIYFRQQPPTAVLAMGGFTAAPPILAAKEFGARTFVHESNTVPGRANRWLSRLVDRVFVGFPHAASRLKWRNVVCTGTPVRPQFQPGDAAACRAKLFGAAASDFPVLLVMGGSQGASGINELILKGLPLLAKSMPQLRLFHLAGPNDAEKIRQACAALHLHAVVHPFFAEMELALGAATVAVSRAGASSLAELAAMRVPSVLVPFPAAAGNHQFHNARVFEETGAARKLEQKTATPETLVRLISDLIEKKAARDAMQAALAKWHAPGAAGQMAEEILRSADCRVPENQSEPEHKSRNRLPPGATKHRSFSAV